MSYSSFSEFLNSSREAKDLLGTRSLLKGQTGDYSFHTDDLHSEAGQEPKSMNATNDSWASCTETLQGLLEQYMNDPNSLSSFKQILLAQNTLQASVSHITDKEQEEVTSETPPPLLHRPPKRFLEQSDASVSSPEKKRFRQEPDEKCSRLLFKNISNFREEMFEKSRSIGSSSKQLRPPPPLLKQAGVDSSGQEDCRLSPQDHYILTKEAYKPNAERNNTILNERSSKAINVEHLSTFSPVLKVDPLPREIEGDCKSSLGGYAFDHTAMPKIVAVHSISKKGEDTDEWERNKAFIAKVKGTQTKPGTSLPRKQDNSQMTRFASEKIKRLAAQAASDDKDAQQTTIANERKKASNHVSFERYVLYHLLSKFQGNVEQVKHVLKQNLLQEWLSYCQGNVDPRLQNFSGINFHELRKLYEIWSHLQGSKQPQSNVIHTPSKVQISNGLQRQDNLLPAKNHPGGFSDSQRSSNTQQFQASFAMRRERNENPQDTSKASQWCSRSPIYAPRTPSKFEQHNSNGHIAGAKTESYSNKNISAQIQEKICILSQDSLRGSLCRNSASPIVPSIQQNRDATRTVCSSTYKTTPQLSPFRHFSFLNEETQSTCSSKLESSRENSVIKRAVMQDVPGRLSHKGEAGAFWPNEKHVNINHLKASESRQSNVLVQGENRIKSTNSASLTLLHISQENSAAKNSPSLLIKATPSNVLAKVNHGSVQPQDPSKEACQSRTHDKDAVRSQETKANYLWRFKGGKLISDSIDNGKTIAEVDIQQNLAEYYSCNIQISQTDVQILHQEHKKVCGAAASGQRCYCILGPRGNLQSTQERKNPIQGVQQIIKSAEKKTPVRSLLLQNQGSNVNSKNMGSVSVTPSTQAHLHNSQATQKVHAGLIERCTHPYAGHQDSSKAKAIVDLKLSEDTKQAHVYLTNSFNTPQTYVIQKAMANAQLSNEHTGHQSNDRYNVNRNGEVNQTMSHAQDKASYNSCHSSQGFQLSFPGFSLSNKETNQKPHIRELQTPNAGFINSSAVQESQPSSTSAQITQKNLTSNVLNHCLSPYTQVIQQSRASPLVSQNSQENRQDDTCLKKMLSAQHTLLPNSTHPFSPDAQGKQQINQQNLVSRDKNLKQELKVKYACAVHNNQQPSASLNCLHNGKTNQQSNPSFYISRNPARNQQYHNRCNTPSTAQTTRQCNVSVKFSQPSAPLVVTIAPKVNKTTIPNEQPVSSSNFSHPRTSANKNGLPVAAKSEKVKENEKQSSFHTPLSPRKQYNSLHQLAKKITETRERFEMESIPWKKKILKSLEGVLMKKLKKIEKETGEEADLFSGGNSVSENTTEVEEN